MPSLFTVLTKGNECILYIGPFFNYVNQILSIIDHLPTVDISEGIPLLENLHTSDIFRATYLLCFVNVVKERPHRYAKQFGMQFFLLSEKNSTTLKKKIYYRILFMTVLSNIF